MKWMFNYHFISFKNNGYINYIMSALNFNLP